ncbi:F0F1 ATP synthase subunit delta [Photobacterium sanguinicancri]|uniref:ATP synthase subunit delta n=1 Tax=Photobacterium sanguinicancri TaxID=875932 RepID=A0AAW7Y1V7_9GAMM|nr:F0F1 ATP synthase subunit delta [Photobacterium sanguinicancri]MDO6497039.1 F0F1 ATP synthase subunit delta [Photobacterium sanguinicancri]MDO6541288.1 F0F1 ATP synthase subunit delta [Photobacterium sanguinicancri]
MSDSQTIAYPYAKAAFDYARDADQLEAWENMLVVMKEVAEAPIVASQIEALDMLGPDAHDAFNQSFLAICDGLIDEHGQNLVKLMAENGRLAVLPQVTELYQTFKSDFERTVEACVVTAEPLDEQQANSLSQALERKLNRTVSLTCQVDKSLVGGIKITAGELVIDGSLKSAIDRLAIRLEV